MHQALFSCSIPTKILLSMDFSSSSYGALEMATDIPRHLNTELCPLNLVPILPILTGAEFFPETAFMKETGNRVPAPSAKC
jgi:hypothetical protein